MTAASRSQRVATGAMTSLAGSMPVPPAMAADEEDTILREIHERDRQMEELQARRGVFDCRVADVRGDHLRWKPSVCVRIRHQITHSA